MARLKIGLVCFSLFVFVVMSGCSTGRLVKTYEGAALNVAEVGKLVAPENISLISVNGQAVPHYLLSSLDVNYALKAGENLVVFQYESIWGKAKKGKNGARSESVTSEQKEVLLNVVPGESYTFDLHKPTNVREARKFADDFQVSVYDGANDLVAESQKLNYHALLAQSLVKGEAGGSSKIGAVAHAGDKLEALKLIWSTATAEQKRAFLAWAFQE